MRVPQVHDAFAERPESGHTIGRDDVYEKRTRKRWRRRSAERRVSVRDAHHTGHQRAHVPADDGYVVHAGATVHGPVVAVRRVHERQDRYEAAVFHVIVVVQPAAPVPQRRRLDNGRTESARPVVIVEPVQEAAQGHAARGRPLGGRGRGGRSRRRGRLVRRDVPQHAGVRHGPAKVAGKGRAHQRRQRQEAGQRVAETGKGAEAAVVPPGGAQPVAGVRFVLRRRPGGHRDRVSVRPADLSERGRQVDRGRMDGGRRVRLCRLHRLVRRVHAG